MPTKKSVKKVVNLLCYNCGSAITVKITDDKIPGCVRCPGCGQKTCSE